MTADEAIIDSGSRHGSSRHGSSSSSSSDAYFHRTVAGGSRIRGGSAMLPDYSGHGTSASGRGPLKNPRTRVVVVAPAARTRKDDAADADADAGVEATLANAVSEDEADEVDDIFKVVRPAWVDDPDAGLSPDERKYGEFADFLDFWKLLDFLDVLRSDDDRKKGGSVFDVFGYRQKPSVQGTERGIDELMRETEGGGDEDGGKNALGRFLDVLMQRGKDDAEGRRDDAAFDAFLRALDSDAAVVEPRGGESKGSSKGGGSSMDWSEVLGGMSPEDRRIPPELLLRSYWRGVVDPDRDPRDPTAEEVPAGWMDHLRSWFGRGGANAGDAGEAAVEEGAESATGAKHGEGDAVTVPSEDQIV